MNLDTGLTLISAICTIVTVYYTFIAKKYYLLVKEYFSGVKRNLAYSHLITAVAEMQKFGAGCTSSSLKGLSSKSHSSSCIKVQNFISELRRSKQLLNTKTVDINNIIMELDQLLLNFSAVEVVETESLMKNGKALYNKLNELENHFDPISSIPSP